MGCLAFFFFWEIEHAFECSLLLASDFSIQVKVFGRVWWDSKFALLLSVLLLLVYNLHLENFILSAAMTQNMMFIYQAKNKSSRLCVCELSPVWLFVWLHGL